MKNFTSSFKKLIEIHLFSKMFRHLPHSNRILDEIINAKKANLNFTVIILSSSFIDIFINENTIANKPLGLSILNKDERNDINWLKKRRNDLIHFNNTLDGFLLSEEDDERLKKESEIAINIIVKFINVYDLRD